MQIILSNCISGNVIYRGMSDSHRDSECRGVPKGGGWGGGHSGLSTLFM